MTVADACSCANFNDVRVRHISLKWDVHFSMQVISGSASLNCQLINDVDHINLDVKELAISSITVNGIDVRYRISPNAYSFYGSTLKVYLPEELSKAASTVAVFIKYSTSKEASALQWLKVAQTADKLAPYLLSQCQPIHARSLLPCMDTPAIKQTYDAQVRVASDLTCLMSALSFDNPHDEHDHTTFYFRQPMPIPTYLIAIVVGRLSKRDISDRCAIWSEPSIADVAKNEFIEVEEILGTAEDIVGKYLWGRLDLICMPPSFPFGGMENPCLIFVTPTIIAGDRSLVNVIAHEVAHSWAGNLVTNANWDDFWLNEGFATFIERKILGRLVSEEYRQFMSYNGWHSTLKSTVYNEFSSTHRFTRMIQKHKNTDPDESFSAIPYEKGSALLLLIEQKIGDNDLFDAYIRDYIREFALKSVTSAQWKDHLYKFFEQKHDILNSIDFDKWFHGTGMPPEQPKFDTKMVDACQSLTNRWIHGSTEEVSSMNSDQYDKLAPSQKIEFLSMLWQYDAPLEEYKLEKLNELYRLNATSNFEILYFWIRLAIKSHWEPIIEVALSFLAAQGRMKYSRPVYKDLVSWPASRVMARDHFLKNRISMHPIAVEMIAKDLHLRNPSMSVAF